jgi:uncharacterized protein (TIGR00725 family)
LINVAVLGSSVADEDSTEYQKAFRIGCLIAEQRACLFTGACLGYPYAAVQGAHSVGGFAVGISPASDRSEHSKLMGYHLTSDTTVFTGMGKKGRNVILVRSADVAIFIGGGMGTLNEFTIAFDELTDKGVIGILASTGGFSDLYLRIAKNATRQARCVIIADQNPDVLMTKLFSELLRENRP